MEKIGQVNTLRRFQEEIHVDYFYSRNSEQNGLHLYMQTNGQTNTKLCTFACSARSTAYSMHGKANFVLTYHFSFLMLFEEVL